MPNVPQTLDFPRQPDESTKLPEWVKAFHKIAQRQWTQMTQAYNALLKISLVSERPSTPQLNETLWYENDTGRSFIGVDGVWIPFSNWTGGVTNTSVSYIMATSDAVVLGDATSGSIVVTVNNGSSYASRVQAVKKVDATANSVTVAPSSGAIDGASTYILATTNEAITFTSYGGNLYVTSRVL